MGPFIVINGDILTNMDYSKMFEYAVKKKSILTVGTKVITRPFEFGQIHQDGEYITGIEEKPDIKYEILAGVYVLQPSALAHIPKNKYFGIDDLIRKLLIEKIPVMKYNVEEFWL